MKLSFAKRFRSRAPHKDLRRRRWTVKIAVILLLAVGAVVMFLMDLAAIAVNKKMMDITRREASITHRYENIKTEAEQIRALVLPLTPDADLEKIKNRYINDVMNVLTQFNLKVDSYRSEVAEADGFQLFKYNVSVLGDFVDVIRFFNVVGKRFPFLYVDNYIIKLHGEKFVRMDLKMEILGEAAAAQ